MTARRRGDKLAKGRTYLGLVVGPREVDDALDLAIDRTIGAQDDFRKVPVADPKALPKADKVVHRAEDVRTLADEADKPGVD